MQKPIIILILFGLLCAYHGVQAQESVVKRSTVIEQYKGKPYYLHFVKQGETLFGISKAYNISVEELQAENPELEKGIKMDQVLRIPVEEKQQKQAETAVKSEKTRPDTTRQQQKGQQFIDHYVSKKETLYGISKQYGVSVDDLIKANPSMTELKNGMVIRVPVNLAPKTNTEKEPVAPAAIEKMPVPEDGLLVVKQGQTLYSISRQYDVPEEELIRLNPELSEGLKAGQTIRLKDSAKLHHPEPVIGNTEIPAVSPRPVTREASPEKCKGMKDESAVYEVALLLPFNLDMADSILKTPADNLPALKTFRTFDYFQYYAGSMMALDSLEKAGYRVNFHVFDADSETDTLKIKKALRNKGMSQMDLIIGPVFARSFSIAARFAEQNNIPIVNPLSRRSSIVENNSFVYKVYPGEQAIASGMASYISEKFPGANIISVRNSLKENGIMAGTFADSVRKHHSGQQITEVIYQEEGFTGVSKLIDKERKNVIILFSSNKSLVPAFVSKLNAFSNTSDIVLFGIPGWEDIDIETEFLLALDYHQAVPSFINYDDSRTKRFITQYRDKYGAEPLPEKEAFLGFDVTFYFLSALGQFGRKFGECLPYYGIPGIQYNFRFRQPVSDNGFENTDVRILHYTDYRWIEDQPSIPPGQ